MNHLENIAEETLGLKEDEFARLRTTEERSRFVLSYAVLAPSTLNTQPWLFSIQADQINLMADRRRGLAVMDTNDRQLVLSCGAALHNLILAMRRFGHDPKVRRFPDLNRPDLLATIKWGPKREPTEYALMQFRAITNRRTRGLAGDSAGLADSDLEELRVLAAGGGVELAIVRETAKREMLKDLAFSAFEEQVKSPLYQRERACWTHNTRRMSRDGLPGSATRTHSNRGGLAFGRDAHGESIASEAVLAVLTTRNDSHSYWLQAGCALQRLLLGAAHLRIQATFINQALELPAYRQQVSDAIGPGRVAQAMMLFGPSRFVRPTARRSLDDFLIQT